MQLSCKKEKMQKKDAGGRYYSRRLRRGVARTEAVVTPIAICQTARER